MSSFFNNKLQHKYTFRNSRGKQSMIEYFISNTCRHLHQILDIKTIYSVSIGNEHNLLLGKIKRRLKRYTTLINHKKKINVKSILDLTVIGLYQRWLKQKSYAKPILDKDNINNSWHKFKSNIRTAAVFTMTRFKSGARISVTVLRP